MLKNMNLKMLCKAYQAYKARLRISLYILSLRNERASIVRDIYGKHGVEELLQLVQSQADDPIGHFTEFNTKHVKSVF